MCHTAATTELKVLKSATAVLPDAKVLTSAAITIASCVRMLCAGKILFSSSHWKNLKVFFLSSDSNHYCCKDCQIARAGYKCYSSPNYIECFEEHSYCDGINKDCPSQKPKQENTTCYSVDFGKCSSTGQCLSLCQQINPAFFQCKCPVQEEKCMICCRNPFNNNDTDECKPLHRLFSSFSSPLYLSDGRACFDGLCENVIFLFLRYPT